MILHVDMDAFYASVEERECPSLVGQPVVVGGSAKGRGVVAAANYEARKFGIHSAMPSAVADRLCPHAVVIRPRIEFYSEISREIRQIFDRYTPLIEPLSLDEAFLDVTASETLFGSGPDIARHIKKDIVKELGLVASVGVATNKFIAKLASDLEKPDGLVVVYPGTEQSFLDPLPVGCVWGIGKASGEIFRRLGIHTIGDLRRFPLERLQRRFGSHGEQLWRLARGIDKRVVVPDHEAKSISHENTFEQDIGDPSILRSWLLDLTEQVGWRLRRHRLRARTVQIKIRYSDFHTITRARSLKQATDLTNDLWRVADKLMETSLRGEVRPVRLLGVGASGFDDSSVMQEDLFDMELRKKQSKIDSVMDSVTERFGKRSMRRGGNPRE